VGAARRVTFGRFEFDPLTGELRKSNRRVRLAEQSAQVLTALLERAGDLVTRDELRERLWPGDTVIDFDHGLNSAVRRLRDALGDSAERPKFVETVPRKG
jgi:DNA-binding winged helix-turn-helix (wHTH) protein